MKKVFISQPMRGKSDEEILKERKEALERCKSILGEDVKEIQSFFPDVPADTKPLWCLGESLKLMADADIVYFCKGWDDARGCYCEHIVAVAYNYKTMFYNDTEE